MKLRIVPTVLVSLLSISVGMHFSTPAFAQADTSFAKDAAEGGIAEVKLGELAQQKGSSNAVKEFGKRMETDHSKADERLSNVAMKENISLPSDLSLSDRLTYDHLSKLSGAEFDKAYAQDMVKDHEKDIAAFRKEAMDGKNPELKQFASETLPTLETHLKLAQEMARSTGASTSSAASY